MILIIKNRNKITDQELVQSYAKKFSTFFQDFKNEGLKSWMIYPFFILKRVLIVVCYIFIDDGVLQLSLIAGVSFWVMHI